MAFPTYPVDGEKYNNYVFDASAGLWKYLDFTKIPEGATFHLPSYSFAKANGDYLMVSPNGKLGGRFNKQAWTLSAWVYMPTLANYGILWSYDYTSHVEPYYAQQIRIEGDGDITVACNNGGNCTTTRKGVVPAATWKHVVVQFVPGDLRLYVDLALESRDQSGGNISYYAQEVWVGRGNWDTTADMSILDLRWYPRFLTADERSALFYEFNKPEYVEAR